MFLFVSIHATCKSVASDSASSAPSLLATPVVSATGLPIEGAHFVRLGG
jgi:hypothetical protein